MKLDEFLKVIVKKLQCHSVQFALAGGLAASLYRKDVRSTNDIDLLFFTNTQSQSEAEKLIQEIGLHPFLIRKADLEGGPLFAIKRKSTPVFIVAGRNKEGNTEVGVDFILPTMPWFAEALKRAQANQIDFGFGEIPCLTVEDIVLSKIYSFKNNQQRFQDLDDLKSIFEKNDDLDLSYLAGQIAGFKWHLSDLVKALLPDALRRVVAKSK